ncbi:Gfo/Idh/MocA family protein [Streptomyces tubercidicus]|uniref:Gfo/Idh/MocA family protein n=1 Tax=Streptomyces tubercidicus TaxID=47759 RepID=UPI003F5BF345
MPLTFSSAEELARSEEVDLVVVTVRVPQHLELIRPALEAGKMVFSEWPLGADLAQAEELADLAHRRGVLTAVGLQARSAPPLRYLRDLVAEGYVGRVLSTSMLGSGGYWGATYDDSHAYLLDVTSGATLLSIPFGHSLDALAMVLGEFREVSAHMENQRRQVTHVTSGAVAAKSAEDQIAVTGLLESGAVAAMPQAVRRRRERRRRPRPGPARAEHRGHRRELRHRRPRSHRQGGEVQRAAAVRCRTGSAGTKHSRRACSSPPTVPPEVLCQAARAENALKRRIIVYPPRVEGGEGCWRRVVTGRPAEHVCVCERGSLPWPRCFSS